MKTDDNFKEGIESSAPLDFIAVPDHELLCRIARGSYGEVWLARNIMGVYRAIKVVHRDRFDNDRPFDREMEGIQKFEPISRSHDSFVNVLQVGRNDRQRYFYYVMELGDDDLSGQAIDPGAYKPKTLASEVELRGRLSVEECLRLGMALSDALDHLHSHGLTHRDIKPSNIIFINGIPKLADIGLVTAIGPDRSYVGTEGYIPPEGPGSSQADIFALGKVLYEIATGMDRQAFPELPENFDRFADAEAFREFNEVTLRACQADPKKRFASAREMTTELSLLLNGQSVRRLRLLEKRWILFKRAGVVAAMVLAVSFCAAYPVLAQRKQARAEKERRIGAMASEGYYAMNDGNMTGAFAAFAETLRLTEGSRAREELDRMRCGSTLAQCPKLVQMSFQTNYLGYVDFDPQTKRLLITSSLSHADILDVESGKFISKSLKVPKLFTAVFSADGSRILTTGANGLVQLWDAESQALMHTWLHPDNVMRAKIDSQGETIATGCEDGKVRLWSVSTGKLLWEYAGHANPVISVSFNADGSRILSSGKDSTARILDARTGALIGAPLQHTSWVYEGGFSPDGRRVVTGCFDRKARVWDAASSQLLPPMMPHGDAVQSSCFSPDGSLIVTSCLDGTVRLWESDTQRPRALNPVLRHSSRVLHATLSRDGSRIATCCVDGTTRIWDITANSVRPKETVEFYSRDGSRSVKAEGPSTYRIWNELKGAPCSPPLPLQGLKQFVFSQNGAHLLAVFTNRNATMEIKTWDAATGAATSAGMEIQGKLQGAKLAYNGRLLVAYAENDLWLWEIKARKCILGPRRFVNPIQLAVISPDSSRVLVLSESDVYFLDAIKGVETRPPLRYSPKVSYAAYSPDGRKAVLCLMDGSLREWWAQIWDSQFERPIGRLLTHRDGVLHAAFSPDSRRIVTSGEEFVSQIWDAETGLPLTRPMKHDDQVQAAGFSQDGQRLITASTDRTARIWDAATGEPLAPPMRHTTKLWNARFLSGKNRILTETEEAAGPWIWELPLETRPVKDLLELATLLSPTQSTVESQAGSETGAQRNLLESLWMEHRLKYPAEHSTTAAELSLWHRHQAETAEIGERWYAAIFHWKILAAAEPANPAWSARQARCEKALADQTRVKP